MKLTLTVLTVGKMQGKIVPITRSPFLIGRDPECHLRPGSPLISNKHCAILVRAGRVYVRDFNSTNGTQVDGQPIEGETELLNGQQLQIGPLGFQVGITSAAIPVDAATPLPPTKAAGPATKAAGPVNMASAHGSPAHGSPAHAASPHDDEAAALLLSLQDDVPSSNALTGADPTGVPEGTTVLILTEPAQGEGAKSPGSGKPAGPSKKAVGDTSSSAKAILEKYLRRARV